MILPQDVPRTIRPVTKQGWYELADGRAGYFCFVAEGQENGSVRTGIRCTEIRSKLYVQCLVDTLL